MSGGFFVFNIAIQNYPYSSLKCSDTDTIVIITS